jgi:hypothetical protein
VLWQLHGIALKKSFHHRNPHRPLRSNLNQE